MVVAIESGTIDPSQVGSSRVLGRVSSFLQKTEDRNTRTPGPDGVEADNEER